MEHRIGLTATVSVSAWVQLTADTREEAEKIALKMAESGNVEWVYDRVEDDTIELG